MGLRSYGGCVRQAWHHKVDAWVGKVVASAVAKMYTVSMREETFGSLSNPLSLPQYHPSEALSMSRVYPPLCFGHVVGLPPPSVSGRTLAAIRTMFGLAAEDVARCAGLTAYSLSRLERQHRQPRAGEVASLLSAMGQLVEQPEQSQPARLS